MAAGLRGDQSGADDGGGRSSRRWSGGEDGGVRAPRRCDCRTLMSLGSGGGPCLGLANINGPAQVGCCECGHGIHSGEI